MRVAVIRPPHGLRAVFPVVAVIAAGVLWSGVAVAMEPCAVLAPGADGVLRLDGAAGGCGTGSRAYRAYDAPPGTFEDRPSRPKVGPVRPQVQAQPQPPSQIQSPAQPQAAAPMQPQVAARSEERPVVDTTGEDVARLKTETARLKDEMARLRDEASRLRAETARLRNELALREAPPSGASVGKIESKVGAGSGAPAIVPKGDLLVTEPRTSEVAKTSPEKTSPEKTPPEKTAPESTTSPDKKSDAQAPDERAFERQKGVVERAWKQLLDLAGRMKSDVSGKTE